MRRRFAALGAAAALAAVPALACAPPDGFGAAQRIESARWVVFYRTVPAAIGVGDQFEVDALVCPRDASAPPSGVMVDAYMPEHRHGMNSRPRVVLVSPGRYRAEGFLFHMPGLWQLRFDVDGTGGRERLSHDIDLP